MAKKKEVPGTPGIKTFRLSQLRAADYNPRVIDEAALAGLTKSIERFGCVEPIVVNIRGGRNIIVGGHQRLKALAGLGVKQCICVTVDCTEADEKLLNLSLNNPLIQGEFIEQIGEYIAALQGELPKDSAFLDMRIAELAGDIASLNKGGLTPDDQVPERPKKAKTKRGDLYILGEHRLLCGDSTKVENVAYLMDAQRAQAMISDPPFGVRDEEWDKFGGDDGFRKFTEIWVSNASGIADVVVTFMADRNLPAVRAAAEIIGLPYRRALIWRKPPGSQFAGASLDGFWFDFELVQVFGKPKFKPRKDTRMACLEYRTVTGQDHGCEKPVELLMDLIEGYVEPENIVADFFSGVGTTLIACEKLNRKCFGMEIDPIYCDVIVRRWEEFTGKKTELIRGK